jgi:hypothetical protein
MAHARRAHTVHYSFGDKFALIIGGLSFSHLKLCEKMDLKDQKCSHLGILHKKRAWPGTIKIDSRYYVFGGNKLGDPQSNNFYDF